MTRRWPVPGLADRFGVRLGLILTLALAPVGIIALVQSAGIGAEVRARTETALAGETLRAAAAQLGRIADAQGLARGLSITVPSLDSGACAKLLQSLAGPDQTYGFIAFYGADGVARCASSGMMADVSRRPFFLDFRADPKPMLRMVRSDPNAPPDLMVAIAPVPGQGGAAGFVIVAPAQTRMLEAPDADRDFALLLFDRNGNILSANMPMATIGAMLPSDRDPRQMASQPEGLFPAAAAGGGRRLYSLNALMPDEIYALGSWPDRRGHTQLLNDMSPLLLPAAMWAMCLFAAWLAAELMVTRHMRRFRRAITSFAEGNRRLRPMRFAHAPLEIREAADAFEHMTDTILKDEAELENSVREKEALLREVHHRVKNNLQLMASIINLQIRRTRSDEAKTIMRRLQDRMLSLATIHNNLFHTANVTEVETAPLFAGIVDQIVVSGAGAGKRFDVDASFDPVSMSPEQVVPLALLITEALGWAMKTADGAGPGLPRIALSLRQTAGGMLVLTVVNPLADEAGLSEQDHDDSALGNQLIHAFALQLGGSFHRDIADGRQVQRLEFQLKPMGAIPPGTVPQG
ncbi:MAG: histidine kinase dimerization/phosphoacceptor domain -containing protein [Paracoccaceae bacterium]